MKSYYITSYLKLRSTDWQV